ncbi:MAG TPA: helicase-related protein [Chitinispirillaceae bacterium]|nr:helicase-related protein [Chitinispirillaceae bacterium]
MAARLKADIHYTIDYQYKEIEILDTVDFHTETAAAGIPKQFSGESFLYELLRQALIAKEFFHRDKQYVIQDEKIVIVDEFTGRTMAQRSWSEGLHQMVEAKEKLPVTPPNETLARLSFQRYFRFYHNLCGMTGTAKEAASELWHIYGLPVIQIPPNKPSQRSILSRKFFPDQDSKHAAIIEEIIAMHELGRPVLVGTRSVKRSEEIASRLTEKGYNCKVINAVRHQQEAAVVAEAGKKGAITVATNMAGRGTDIILDKECENAGGLHVIASECNDSARIDRQLYGRCARQGDKGSARSYVSLDDELLRRYLNPAMLRMLKNLLGANNTIAINLGNLAVKQAQDTAQKRAYSMRKSIQKMDTWLKDSLSFSKNEF